MSSCCGRIFWGLALQDGTAGKVYPTKTVDFRNHDGHLVAHVANVFHALDATVAQLRDVDEAFFAREELHEGPDVYYTLNLAGVDLSHFDFLRHSFDDGKRLVGNLGGGSSDEHRSVFFDVDGGPARLLLDLSDGLPTGPDYEANLFRVDLRPDNLRCMLGHVVSGGREHFGHLL